jgi:ADP-ribosylglycohydrolase
MISEMSLALSNALVEGKGTLDLDLILKHYKDWIEKTNPPLGKATYNALA